MRGYFGIGVYMPKKSVNIGTLWRSALIFGAQFVFTVGRRYKKQASDTAKAFRHIPLFHFGTYDEFKEHIPYDCIPICVELTENSTPLIKFKHPERAVYMLGAEDFGIPEKIMSGKKIIQISSTVPHCLNVSVAGSIIMYDRMAKCTSD